MIPAASGSALVGSQVSVILHPQQDRVRSKTGVMDETLLVDDPDLVQILEKVQSQHARGPFVLVSAKEFGRMWTRAAAARPPEQHRDAARVRPEA